ncbi:hypothetical protein [Proteiniclasticum sp.]|uniref:hypothetical protein n=1 Tax=Proteiniclasticum sp. TaxID=2053595 RepID=UPI0028965AF1|nr:hypothetical protein [Proteiniclasticum sp.]
MGKVYRTILFLSAIIFNFGTLVYASEELSKSSMVESTGDVYRQAFYAAAATMLVMGILWLIIFRPKFKSSNEEF